MSALQPVSFRNGRGHEPRLSMPYVPGKHSRRFWSERELKIFKHWYPKGGAPAVLVRLPGRSLSSVYGRAQILGLASGKSERIKPSTGFEDRLRHFYENGDGHKRGECNAFADKEKLPRWWVTKRATALGLVIPHKKEPPWTKRELALMPTLPLHDLDRSAKIMREHGFARSATAINVKAKRLNLSRRFREAMSATSVSKILGIDSKGVTAEILRGALKAGRRQTKRRIQQGGDWWTVTPAQLRRYIVDHLERIDLRKVDKFAFVQVLVGEPLETIQIPAKKKARK